MAKIEGGVPLAGFAAPTDDQDTYAVTDERFNKGGFRSVDTNADMEAITEERRSDGMLVWVRDEKKLYQLQIDQFVLFPLGGGGDSPFDYLSETEPVDPEVGKVWFNTSTGVISIYKEITNDDGSTTNKWVSSIDSLGGVTYNNSTPTTAAVGGVPAGTTFENKSMSEVFNMLFYPYQEPAITQLTTNYSAIREVGLATEASITITWNTSNQGNIRDDSVKAFVDGTAVGTTTLPKRGNETFTITPLNKQVDGTIPVKLQIQDTKGKEISKTTNITWMSAIYFGTNNNATVSNADILGFNKVLVNSYKRTYEFPAGGYKYVAYPARLGNANVFFNAENNLPVPVEKVGNVDVTNANNVTQSYAVYRTSNVLGGSIKITFG